MGGGLRKLYSEEEKRVFQAVTTEKTQEEATTTMTVQAPEEEVEKDELESLLREGDVIMLTDEPAIPVFVRDDASFYKQTPSKSSRTKLRRKQAATSQREKDVERVKVLQPRMEINQKEDSGDAIIEKSHLSEELKYFQEEGTREDVTGHIRHTHEEKGKAISEEEMKKDVESLVHNLRLDMVLDGNPEFPEELKPQMDAYTLTKLYAEDEIARRKELLKEIAKGTPEFEAQVNSIRHMESYALWVRNAASQQAVTIERKTRNIKAYKLAAAQIRYESYDTAYRAQMLDYIDKRVAELQDDYEKDMAAMMQHMKGTGAQDIAYQNATRTLAQLKQAMDRPGTSEDTRAELMAQGKELIQHFDWQ